MDANVGQKEKPMQIDFRKKRSMSLAVPMAVEGKPIRDALRTVYVQKEASDVVSNALNERIVRV